ncbi:hypothetical protein, partial [Klebsiella pneumoniae]|uniref:hypothetical protein n=1 Tax=Klebsiella pneumoniae TaxID=573 RepID=UPI0036368D55
LQAAGNIFHNITLEALNECMAKIEKWSLRGPRERRSSQNHRAGKAIESKRLPLENGVTSE